MFAPFLTLARLQQPFHNVRAPSEHLVTLLRDRDGGYMHSAATIQPEKLLSVNKNKNKSGPKCTLTIGTGDICSTSLKVRIKYTKMCGYFNIWSFIPH